MKTTLEEKLRLVKLHLDEGIPIFEIEKKYGLDHSTLKYYCALYRRWGEEPFTKSTRRRYSREMKLEAIKDIITNHVSYSQKAIELMLTDPKIVGDWMEKYRNGGEKAITDTYSRQAYKHHDDKILEKEHKKLLEDLEKTKAENEYLKKLYSLVLARSKPSKKKSK